ncbi:MAG: patatin-like phospholipase family protein [Vicinamibacteria bacterium]
MRVGLVLGAGGVQGGAWLTGGLDALAEQTGWDPATADVVVGTSAGSVIASLCVAGIPPWFMVAHSAGETFDGVVDAQGRPAAEADRSGGARYRLQRAWPPIGPGSWSLALRTLREPRRFTPGAAFAGWAPRGVFSTAPIEDIIRRVVPTGWSDHPNHWVLACEYETARRVAFGRAGSPATDLASAVAASCAIPAFYHPVEVGGRRYVDGGIHSTSNLDLLHDQELDLVICLNPTSSLHPARAWNPLERLNGFLRDHSGRLLGNEAKTLRAAGTEVVLVQPLGDDLAAMGPNLMSSKDRNPVIATAQRTVAGQLASPENRELLADLPPGDPRRVRRPAGDPSQWPDLAEIRRLVRERAAN